MQSIPRSILITGCSSGIGLAAASDLKARGWRVFATARQDADLDRLRALGIEAFRLEMADPASIADCAERALRLTDGRLGALFANAAFGQVGAIEDVPPAAMRQQFEVNFFGVHDLTCRLLPVMRRQGAGRIVLCSSVLGLMTAPYRGAYSASKFALEAMADALRLELHDTGIGVSLIEPGPIRTRFLDNALTAFRANIDIDRSPHASSYKRRLVSMAAGGKSTFKLEPEAVVRRLRHALESPRPKARYFVTTPTYVAAALKRVVPTMLLDPFARRQ